MLPEVEHLSHLISTVGLNLPQYKVEAVEEALVPTNVSKLKSFLDLVAKLLFKVLPNLASTPEHCYSYHLLNNNTKVMNRKAGYNFPSYQNCPKTFLTFSTL